MTFSICARERYVAGGDQHRRFGVAVTTRLPAVGTLCPFVSERGAVATQSRVNVALGRRGVAYLEEGLGIEDALQSLLHADEGAPERQLHGVDADDTFAFSGDECNPWYGHVEGANYTVAGNLLAGERVVEAVAETYAAGDRGEPFAARLIDALEAGHAAGGDKRAELTVQSAALAVATTEETEGAEANTDFGTDLRVDASRTPVADLRRTHRLATDEFERAAERYERAREEDGGDGGAEDSESESDPGSGDESGGSE
jgi:uncharacterized Ntn-hydrolase superfamily protein